jgi:DNA-binding SARP family transcriptional activator/DNA-binding transcriptional ArsR family regulator
MSRKPPGQVARLGRDCWALRRDISGSTVRSHSQLSRQLRNNVPAEKTHQQITISLLGPVLLVGRTGQVQLSQFAQRVLLAVLALSANEFVSADSLTDTVWHEQANAERMKNNLHYNISRLRSLLDHLEQHHNVRLDTVQRGYRLSVRAGECDIDVFGDRISQARHAARDGRPGDAARIYRRALSLWRGPALFDVRDASPWLSAEADRLEELRLSVVEERIEADIACGHLSGAVSDLISLVSQHPRRERLRAQLMVGLCRCGREAEALETYASYRTGLRDDLGLEPGPEIRRIHQLILMQDPEVAPSRGAAEDVATACFSGDVGGGRLMCRLPSGIADFTGRSAELAELQRILSPSETHAGPPIAVITGAAGSGKTALALQAAHALREFYPSGQLYVHLAGTAGRPVDPLEALGEFLRALGASRDNLPATLDERAAVFRARVADRRVLIVADDAATAAQVRPLMPGTSTCAMLVTGRTGPRDLGGAKTTSLRSLSVAETIQLIGKIAGPERITADRGAAGELAAACGGLPLAVRIVGIRLASRPSWPVATLAAKLENQGSCLDELSVGELSVRARIEPSYRHLDPDAQHAFAVLARTPQSSITLKAAAALLNESPSYVERALERLADAHLIEALAPGQYRLHRLMRAYASEQPLTPAGEHVPLRSMA